VLALDIKKAYIWLDKIKEKCKLNLIDEEIEAIDLCKLMIKEKTLGYADERVNND
jgi:hypothetical protein